MGRLAVDIVERKVQDELVTALTDKTFNSTRESNELMVSLFYLPCKYCTTFRLELLVNSFI